MNGENRFRKFAEIKKEEPTVLYLYVIDLSAVHTDQKIEISGDYLAVESMNASDVVIKLNNQTNASIDLTKIKEIQGKFDKIYLTNTAQTGGFVKLFVGYKINMLLQYETPTKQNPFSNDVARIQIPISSLLSDGTAFRLDNVDVTIGNAETITLATASATPVAAYYKKYKIIEYSFAFDETTNVMPYNAYIEIFRGGSAIANFVSAALYRNGFERLEGDEKNNTLINSTLYIRGRNLPANMTGVIDLKIAYDKS